MIVISQSLVLSAGPGIDLSRPVLGWHNVVTASGISADTEDENHPASNLANPSTVAGWKAGDTSQQYLTFATGVGEIDYVGIAPRHNLGSGHVTVSIEGEDPGEPDSWSEIVDEFIPADDSAIIARFSPDTYSRVRIRLQPDEAVPFIGAVYIGKLLVIPTGESPGFTPINLARQDDVTHARSQSGDYLGSIITQEKRSSASRFEFLEYDWYLSEFEPFAKVSRSRPFFYAWAPLSYPRQVGYAWAASDVRPNLNAPLYVDLQIDYDAVAT